MLIAIPTVNNELITGRFGRMTEITFVEVKDNSIIKQFSDPVTAHHEHKSHEQGHNHHEHNGKHQKRHQEIIDKICKADMIIYKSLCQNWRERLKNCSSNFKRTKNEFLTEIIEEIKVL